MRDVDRKGIKLTEKIDKKESLSFGEIFLMVLGDFLNLLKF